MNPRLALVLTAAVFVLSPLLAWLMHAGVIDLGPGRGMGKNRGELVQPPRPLPDFQLTDDARHRVGNNVGTNGLLGKWSLLQIAGRRCADDCTRNIYKMRQVRLATGKDAYRVQRVVMTTAATTTDMAKILRDNPGTHVYRLADGGEALLQSFPGYRQGGLPRIVDRIYIIDPLGNLMMRYAKDVDPADVLADLRQLLKATWIRPRNE